jgi:hypothetical protein
MGGARSGPCLRLLLRRQLAVADEARRQERQGTKLFSRKRTSLLAGCPLTTSTSSTSTSTSSSSSSSSSSSGGLLPLLAGYQTAHQSRCRRRRRQQQQQQQHLVAVVMRVRVRVLGKTAGRREQRRR